MKSSVKQGLVLENPRFDVTERENTVIIGKLLEGVRPVIIISSHVLATIQTYEMVIHAFIVLSDKLNV